MKFKININTPNSNYYNLDFYLNNYVFNYVSNFIKNTYNQNNIKYYLNINYKKFNYQNIISYVLYIAKML